MDHEFGLGLREDEREPLFSLIPSRIARGWTALLAFTLDESI